jgi:GNAT superfamily N-acetyltransferase
MVERYAKSLGYDVVVDDRRGHTMFVLDKDQSLREESFNGIDIDMDIEGDEIMVTAMGNGRELGHVLFVDEGEYLMPQDLEVDERFQGQGIAAAMYDYVKSKGYKIRRSGQQTDAGAGFWGKHRPEQNVWENFADGKKSEMNLEQGDCPIFAIALHRLSKLPLMALVEYDDEMGSAVLIHAYVKLNDKWRIDATGETDVDWMLQKYPNNGAAEEIEISERDLIKLGYGKNKCPTLQQVVPHAKEVLQDIELNENFADGKVKGKSRPGRVKRAGASCNGSVTDLRARAKNASGEKAKMYHWCANMKSGRKK